MSDFQINPRDLDDDLYEVTNQRHQDPAYFDEFLRGWPWELDPAIENLTMQAMKDAIERRAVNCGLGEAFRWRITSNDKLFVRSVHRCREWHQASPEGDWTTWKNMPVLKGVLGGREKKSSDWAFLHVTCPYCHRDHQHGWKITDNPALPTHRGAHCGGMRTEPEDFPFKKRGYLIRPYMKGEPAYPAHRTPIEYPHPIETLGY